MASSDLDPTAYAALVAVREGLLRNLAAVALAAAAATVLFGVLLHLPQGVFVTMAGVLGLGVLAARALLWKCPACGAQLPGRGSSRVCHGCGRQLPETRSPEERHGG